MNDTPHDEDAPFAIDHGTRGRLRLLFIAASLLLASVLTGALRPGQEMVRDGLALAGALLVAFPIVTGVLTAIRSTGFAATRFYMDQYVVLALAACLATGKYLTGGIVAIVLLFGQMMEERTTIGVELALHKLRRLSRIRARRRKDGIEEEIDSSDLSPGDEIVLRPGDSIPADAVVTHGTALVDQSRVTGESVPVEAGPGSTIFAGTVNLNGSLEARVTGAGSETVMGRVQSIISQAKQSEAPIISLAEDYARYYTPLIILIAASVFFFTQDVERAIAVLVVSIPCAFVLASPSAMVSAIAAGSRMGLLIKSVRQLELARKIDTIVFDKTGTLTQGRLELEETLVHVPHLDAARALRIAASIEAHSNHPVARAISSAVPAEERPGVDGFIEHHGLGLEGVVEGRRVLVGRASFLEHAGVVLARYPAEAARHSQVCLAIDGMHAATFLLADTIRPETRETLDRLRALGISDFVMLTGDRKEAAAHIAGHVGIGRYESGCLPEDKVAVIRRLRSEGRKVMVVGDGLNDAPALAEGDLGVAMGALGNDVTIHTSDVALMTNDLRRLPDLLLLSARTVAIINQNLLCGFAFIITAIALSTAGFISPVAAAFFHEFSAFFVLFNSARLLRFDGIETTAAPARAETSPLPA